MVIPGKLAAYRLFLFSLLLFSFYSVLGQNSITGTIFSAKQKPIPNINILLYSRNAPANLISYSISNMEGKFEVTVASPDDSLVFVTKSLNYKDTVIQLENRSQEIKIILPVEIHKIREVNVKAYPISTKGDTIKYIVNSFARAQDRSIGDVIRNMPGFEVTELGQIYYQGRPIQKYYIEGLDLLEKKYAIANRNLPYKSVGSVEVLQNHQPIKMLENKIASDGTSINIKLKNDVAITGTLYAGAGFSPFLRNVNITPMLFQKNQQLISTWQSNNIGDDLNTQHQPFRFSNSEPEGFRNRKPVLTGIMAIQKPQIEKSLYLKNDANLFSYNQLLKINNQSELKINSSYYHDNIREQGQTITQFYLEGDTLALTETTKNLFYNKSLTTDLTFTQNEKKRYLKNKFSINKFWDSEKGTIENSSEIAQTAQTPHFSLTNEFDIFLPVKKNLLRFYSFIDYNNSPQQLSFSPGISVDELNGGTNNEQIVQKITEENILSESFVQFTLGKKPLFFETTTGLIYEDQHLSTYIEKNYNIVLNDDYRNRLDWSYSELYSDETIKYEKQKFRLNLKFPIQLKKYVIHDKFHQAPSNINRLLINPSLYFKYDVSGFLSVYSTTSYNVQLDDIRNLENGYVITNYRLIKRGIEQLSESKRIRYSLAAEYKNPISGFFSNLKFISSNTTRNLLLKQNITNSGVLFYEVFEKNNQSLMNNLSASVSQYLADWQTTVDIKAYYNKTQKEYLLNDKIGKLSNQLCAIQPGLSVTRWRRVDFAYSARFQYFNQKTAQATTTFMENMQKASVFITPHKKYLFGLEGQFYSTNQSGMRFMNLFFLNASYYFKPQKSKIKFNLKVNNLLNHQEIIRFYSGDISFIRNSYCLRGRQFLATLSIGM